MNQLSEAGELRCANCAVAMQGEFCHACGQSIHSVLKPVHNMLEDGMDMFLHVDGRILRTLPALFLRPGLLTLEYFAGRRVRYVPPFRLMFVLCLLTFFAMHLVADGIASRIEQRNDAQVRVTGDTFAQAANAEQVDQALQVKLAELDRSRRLPLMPVKAIEQLDQSERIVRKQASDRLIALGGTPAAAASVLAPAASVDTLANERSDMVDAPVGNVHIAWLPAMFNQRLTLLNAHFRSNLETIKHGDTRMRREAEERMIAGFFGVLPQTMIVMIPLFAILLKLFYLFRRRLYMEHVIVALHSHAFLFLSLLLITLTGLGATWLKPHAAWAGKSLDVLQTLLLLWMPLYLWIAQRRIYRQGWAMTSVKYGLVGWCYFWLLSSALLIAALLGGAH